MWLEKYFVVCLFVVVTVVVTVVVWMNVKWENVKIDLKKQIIEKHEKGIKNSTNFIITTKNTWK